MKFSELVDIDALRRLCKSFTDITDATTALLDLEGNTLIATGWQDICTCFHGAHPGGDAVRIAALTASVMEEERESILAAGCDEFVYKPYRIPMIFRIMAEHLGVVYRHENDAPLEHSELESEPRPLRLTCLPAEMREALTRAVLELDTDRTLALVGEITRQDAGKGAVLKKLAKNLVYNRLPALLEQDGP